ncbi:DMT family transporter [Neptunomonas sp.]|uniref:DMT family transporter n=1 Tax=Neptunomonas sp. TaxID=1971898 RepID=UPI0025E94E59|nr:DMT family transporter [Neptunomonas sp.]
MTTPSPAMLTTPSLIRIYLKLTTVAFVWGGTFIAGHSLMETLPPITAATARFIVAAVLLIAWVYKTEGGLPRLTTQQLLVTFFLGASGVFLYNVFFFEALSSLPAGRTALLVSLNPIITALVLGLLFGERLGVIRWLGIILAFVGAAIIITRGNLLAAAHDLSNVFGQGEIYMMCAVISWATYTIIGRYALKGLSPLAATTYATLWGLFLLMGTTLLFPPEPDFNQLSLLSIGSVIYLGAFGTVICFVWYYQGIKAIGPSRTAIFTNLVPVFGVLLAMLLLGEPILISMLLGGVLVILGVTMTNHSNAYSPK